jgi:hypothetical protein
MTLLTGDPNAQRLLSDAEAQTLPRPSWLSTLQNVGKQQLGQPEIQYIPRGEGMTSKQGIGTPLGGNIMAVKLAESSQPSFRPRVEPATHALLGHLSSEPGPAFELMYVKHLLGQGRVAIAREMLQRILLQYPTDEKLLSLKDDIEALLAPAGAPGPSYPLTSRQVAVETILALQRRFAGRRINIEALLKEQQQERERA